MTEIEYTQEIEFIFSQFPSYQKVGKVAYKPGIETMQRLDEYFGWPHKSFKTIHIAGTNGKGSTSHMIAAGLMGIGGETIGKKAEKLKVGLYTSPHLVDFRERIKVDGEMVSKEFVYNFIKNNKKLFLELKASFFEITTAMAFCYFKECGVDVAVIECGLGGRLDSTNVIMPVASIITNIGLDHCEYLGYELSDIAFEKCGIIKKGVPVIIGEKGDDDKCLSVFINQAKCKEAPLFFAEECYNNRLYNLLINCELDLKGDCQKKNIKTVVTFFEKVVKGKIFKKDTGVERNIEIKEDAEFNNGVGVELNIENLKENILRAAKITGLRGRWEVLQTEPLVVCDTGHNAHGFKLLGNQINEAYKEKIKINPDSKLFVVFGVVADKDLDSIKDFLPKTGYYFFVHSQGSRSLSNDLLGEKMLGYGFKGEVVDNGLSSLEVVGNGLNSLDIVDNKYNVNSLSVDKKGNVKDGLKKALSLAAKDDFIFVGGSTFVVSEVIE